MKIKKVVILGGGTGTSGVLRGLKYFPIDITAVITVSDNGSSTGKLREEFSAPAVGDIRKVLTNLSTLPDEIKDVMEYRLSTNSDLNGHAMGNLLLVSLLDKTKSLKTSIEYLSKLLDVKHTVLPLSEDYLTLMGETIDGKIVEGEENITKTHKQYKRIFYKEEPHVIPEVLKKIKEADLILLSMGSLYTSLTPHLICKDVVKAINDAKAKVVYICNAMTQPGETDNFTVNDHIQAIEKYLGKDSIDATIVNNSKISKYYIEKYRTEEQKEIAAIFNTHLKYGLSSEDEDKALSDVVRKVKLASIEDEMVHTSDIVRWQELLSLKNKMQKFSISRS